MAMERQTSASGTIGGIEWVDWYDCYKRYKDQKIRAEAQAARIADRIPEDGPAIGSQSSGSPTTSRGEALRRVSDNQEVMAERDSAIDLTPSTSRDDFALPTKKRSPSIRSSISVSDRNYLRKSSIFERPRQASGGSTRSSDTGHTAALKRKKNLVAKMEGWWNAVKSNFVPETQNSPPFRPSTLGIDQTRRIPSAPSSRRGSEMSPIAPPSPAMLAPETTKQPLRTVASHAEFRPKTDSGSPIVNSTSADLARLRPPLPQIPPSFTRRQSLVPDDEPLSRASIDSRRRQPNLRLDLESNVLSRPLGRMPGSSTRTSSEEKLGPPPSKRPSEHTSRSSSYGPLYGPGLTPGIPKWEQTPSPIVPLGSFVRRDSQEDRPVAPGADLTVASVRQHVKRRLNAAKEGCNHRLRETIAAITSFAEDQNGTVDRPYEDAEDYFEAISDSPLVDAEDSEAELGDAFDGLGPRGSE